MNQLNSFLLIVLFSLMSIATTSGQNRTFIHIPSYSPTHEFSQEFALNNLKMGFSRPGVKNRKIFGGVVPYGQVWRAGANDATTFSIQDDVIINGEKLAKGDYVILVIPSKTKWNVIFNKNPKTHYRNYLMDDDVLVLTVPVITLKESVEQFNIYTSEMTDATMKVNFVWENTKVTLNLFSEIDSKIKAEFEKKLAGPNASDYLAMAKYLHNTNGDMQKALEYVNIAMEKDLGYGNLRYKGLILAKLGKDKEAIEWLTKSRDRAASFDNKDYVRANELSIREIKEKKNK